MWEQTLAIFFVLGLLITGLWLLRRKGLASVGFAGGNALRGARRMELIERLPLTPQHSLHLVRFDDRLILIGVSPGSCTQVDSFNGSARGGEWTCP